MLVCQYVASNGYMNKAAQGSFFLLVGFYPTSKKNTAFTLLCSYIATPCCMLAINICLYTFAWHSSQHLALMANHGQRVFRADTTHCAEGRGFNPGLLHGAWMDVFCMFLAFLSHLCAVAMRWHMSP